MIRRRPQFTLKTLLWLMAVVAAFLGGILWQRAAAESAVHTIKLEMRHLQAHAAFVEQDRDQQRQRANEYADQLRSLGVDVPKAKPLPASQAPL